MRCIGCHSDNTIYNCYLCRNPICVDCESKLHGHSICPSCRQRLREQEAMVIRKETQDVNCPCGFLLGMVAAVVTAIAWSQMAVLTRGDFALGGILMGGMVGYGVMHGAGKKRGYSLQQIAFLLTLVGVILGFFLIFWRTQTSAYSSLAAGSSVTGALYAFPAHLGEVGGLSWLAALAGIVLAYYLPHPRSQPKG